MRRAWPPPRNWVTYPPTHRVAGAGPGYVPALGHPVLVGDAEADDTEPGVGGVQVPYAAEHIGVDEQAVVVEVDHDVDVAELPQAGQGHVAAAGAAEVLVDLDGGDLAGEAGEFGQRTAVADQHDPVGGEVLLGDRLQQRVELDGPVSHGHHGHRDTRLHRHATHQTHLVPATDVHHRGRMLSVYSKDVLSTH